MNCEQEATGVSRRRFSAGAAAVALGAAAWPGLTRAMVEGSPVLYEISLAQWSLHRMLHAGELDTLAFPAFARERVGVRAVEFVNGFFKDRAQDAAYLKELGTRAADAGIRCLLIMCDGEGRLGDPDAGARRAAVENHRKWLEAAAALGCHSIRVNAASEGSFDEQQTLAADGLRSLCEVAEPFGLHVLVENHGGLSSHGSWLAGVMRLVDHELCGTLPDFGNFCMDWSRADEPDAWYDRYLGVEELMPFARAVSAKSHEFDEAGNEVRTDYTRMMRIVTDAGYRGFVGIEWEGGGVSELEGVLATKRLLERVREELGG
ncbi:MAG: sugar phosphate isomerase/epimerase family protein [Phycisphaerales bacterium]